jgi:hypothetical protein
VNLWRLAVGASLRPVLWTLGVASLLFVGFFNLLGEPVLRNLSGQGMLGSQLIYTPAQALETLEAYGPRGREVFRLLVWVDFLFVPIYTLWLAGLAVRLEGRLLVNLALGLLGADWAENIVLLALEADPATGLAAMAGMLTLLKWVLLAGISAGLIFAWRTWGPS